MKKDDKSFYCLNLKTKMKDKHYSFYCYLADVNKNMHENYKIVKQEKLNLIFDDLPKEDLEYFDDEESLGDISYQELITKIFENVLQFDIPSDSNFWIFGKDSAIMIQTTYIPPQGNDKSSDLLLINNIIDKDYYSIKENQIYSDFKNNKDNDKLIFILFK